MTWRFWAALALQVAIVAIVPAQSAYTYFTGTPVVLQTLPVDPYDLLRGYSQTLRYTISDWNTLRSLPGGDRLPTTPYAPAPLGTDTAPNTTFYVILEPPPLPTATLPPETPPTPWKPVAVATTLPPELVGDRIALRGTYDQGEPRYGLERYYFPEDRRTEINDRIRQAQQRPTPSQPNPSQPNPPEVNPTATNAVPFVVEVRVDRTGQAVPDRLWIEGEALRF
jgi:uncharacterized membrane-anchored protein